MALPVVKTGSIRSDQVLSNKIPVDMDSKIHWLDGSKYFFEFLTRKLRPMSSRGKMEVEWMEYRLYPFYMTCDAASSAGTTISVDHPEYAHRDQLLYNPRTAEFYLMNEDIGGTGTAGSVTVVNHTGSGNFTTATVAGDVILILGEAHAEGETIPPAYSTQPTRLSTYIMQRDITRQNTDIQREQNEYGMKQLLIDRKAFWIEFKRQWNMLLYLGQARAETTSASGPTRWTLSGLREQISTNQIDFSASGGTLTVAALGEILRRTTYHTAASMEKIAIFGQNAYAQVSALPTDAIRTTVGETSWGKMLKQVVTPHGNLMVGYDPMLTATHGLADVLPIIDGKNIERVVLGGLKDRLYLSVQDDNDIHNEQDVASGTCGLIVHLEELHAWGSGIA